MAYITKARKEVNETLANAISSRFSDRAREEEMQRTRDEWEKAPTNPKNKKKLRDSGQEEPPTITPGGTQLELPLAQRRSLSIGEYGFNPYKSLVSFADKPYKNLESDRYSPIPEDPGNIIQREGPGEQSWSYITPVPPGSLKAEVPPEEAFDLAGGPSFEIPGKRKTGMGSLTPEGVEKLKKANPGAAEKIDQKFKQQQGSTDLFPLAQRPSLLFEALRRKRETA